MRVCVYEKKMTSGGYRDWGITATGSPKTTNEFADFARGDRFAKSVEYIITFDEELSLVTYW